jgi:DNA-binding transcriptional ArsR family regulator
MPLSTADLITHPIRARILVSLMGRELTTTQLAGHLPEIPRASLYRHLRQLLKGELIEIVREEPVRGTVEKVYAVPREAGQIPAGDVATASRAEHLRHFTAFLDTQAACYRAYLQREEIDPPSEVVMVATPLSLKKRDYKKFKKELSQLLSSYQPAESAVGDRHILWVASIPDCNDTGSP